MWACACHLFSNVWLCVTFFHENLKTWLHLDSIQTQFTQNQSKKLRFPFALGFVLILDLPSPSVCPCGKPGAGRAYLLNLGCCNEAMLGQCGVPLKSVMVMFHTCHIAKPLKGISMLVLEKCYLYYFHRNSSILPGAQQSLEMLDTESPVPRMLIGKRRSAWHKAKPFEKIWIWSASHKFLPQTLTAPWLKGL